jgi:hypothetical protein
VCLAQGFSPGIIDGELARCGLCDARPGIHPGRTCHWYNSNMSEEKKSGSSPCVASTIKNQICHLAGDESSTDFVTCLLAGDRFLTENLTCHLAGGRSSTENENCRMAGAARQCKFVLRCLGRSEFPSLWVGCAFGSLA